MTADEHLHPLHEWFAESTHVPIGMQVEHDLPASIGWGALKEGLYVAGTDPERRTELLTQHLLSIAKQGHGLCYIHPERESTLDLLAKLPPERLEDVIWIDLKRSGLIKAGGYDIPNDQRITITPLTVEDEIQSPRLNTDQVSARLTDVLDVYQQDDQVTWAVLSLLEPLLEASIEQGYTLRDLARRAGELFDMIQDSSIEYRSHAEAVFDRAAADAVDTALERDSTVLDRTASLLNSMTVTPHNQVFRKGTSVSFREAITSEAIILVSGTRIDAEPTWGTISHSSTRATQLLATAIVRRLWEGLQDMNQRGAGLYPIAIDRVDAVLPRDSTVLRELLTEAGPRDSPTRGTPWLAGPIPRAFPARLRTAITTEIPARVLQIDEWSYELTETTQWLDGSQGPEASNAISMAVRNESIELMAFNESGAVPFEMFPPYPWRHDKDTLESTITRSCEAHGRTSRLPHPGDIKICRRTPTDYANPG